LPYDGVRAPPQAPVSVFCPLWPSRPCFSLKRLQSLPAPSDEDKPDERFPGEVDYDLMVLESLAALDGPQVPDDAVMAVAHSSQMAVLEVPHVVSMHWAAIPSILDRLESAKSLIYWRKGCPVNHVVFVGNSQLRKTKTTVSTTGRAGRKWDSNPRQSTWRAVDSPRGMISGRFAVPKGS
jgi:hypothetical protein